MRRLAFTAGVGVVLGGMLGSAPAMAGLNRTYVSTAGDDANPCTAASPCRTFQVAHDNTNPGGEILVLNPGGFGLLNITKSISINNDGVGEIGFLGGGITINAGATDIINLRGLTINGVGASGSGIELVTGGSLNIQNCNIGNFVGRGIFVHPGVSTAVAVAIADTVIGANTVSGVSLAPVGSGAFTASFKRVAVLGNNNGLNMGPPATSNGFNVAVLDSVVSSNVTGISLSSNGATANLMVTNSALVNNATGLSVTNATATAFLGGDTITGNTTIAYNALSSGVIKSFGNNYISGNPGGDGGALTSVATK